MDILFIGNLNAFLATHYFNSYDTFVFLYFVHIIIDRIRYTLYILTTHVYKIIK